MSAVIGYSLSAGYTLNQPTDGDYYRYPEIFPELNPVLKPKWLIKFSIQNMRTILWNKQNIIPGVFMFAINAFGLPIVFGLANLIDLFGRNWEIYKTRATDEKQEKSGKKR